MTGTPSDAPQPSPSHRQRLLEVTAVMLRLGFTAFGGPAAHIGLMHDEIVKRRKWVSEQHFLDLLGATNLIPGPNSTEMTVHLGHIRAGWPGLIAGGLGFILPAALITTGLAWAYVQFGTTPAADALLYGIKPVIIAVVLKALWALGPRAIKSVLTAAVGLGMLALFFLGIETAVLLIGGGLLVMLVANARRLAGRDQPGGAALLAPFLLGMPAALTTVAAPFSLGLMFLIFLKIGAVLYGSGYTLLAFIEADFVQRLGWLTSAQVIDAVAVGQVTPGPVLTTATFIGYLLGGLPGAVLATVGVFLPAFVIVSIIGPFIPRLRGSPWAAGFLDGVNAAALGLMAAVTVRLGLAALVDPVTIGVGVIAAVLLVRFNTNTTWLILGGGLIGLGRMLLLG